MKYLICLFAVSALAFCSCSTSGDELEIQQGEESITYASIQKRSEKRGVSYSYQLMEDIKMMAASTSWSYNWGPDVPLDWTVAFAEQGMDFCPMAWDENFSEARIRAYKIANPECKYILAFNEPNLTDQANMVPEVAAQYWPRLRALATELNMKLISPAMNYGTLTGYSDPIKWLDEFFELVTLSEVDGIAIHCYMGNASAMKSYVDRFKKYGKPIWLTEFCGWEKNISSMPAQMSYMSEAINYLESNPDIFRYAWFIPRGKEADNVYPYNKLLTKTKPYQLTELGKVFVNMSTLDKNTFYEKGQIIPAEHYSGINMEEITNESNWQRCVHLRPTTDESGILDVCDFLTGQWIEYAVNIPQTENYDLDIRYSCYLNANKLQLFLDDAFLMTLHLDGTNDAWKTLTNTISLEEGKHTLRLKMESGNICLNWLCFK